MQETTCTQVPITAPRETPAETAAPLSDEALATVGFKKVTAFVRTAQSANALRKQRSREKVEQQGLKQLNIQLPPAMHHAFKEMAKEVQNTGDATAALTTMNIARKLSQFSGWRRLLARLLGLM